MVYQKWNFSSADGSDGRHTLCAPGPCPCRRVGAPFIAWATHSGSRSSCRPPSGAAICSNSTISAPFYANTIVESGSFFPVGLGRRSRPDLESTQKESGRFPTFWQKTSGVGASLTVWRPSPARGKVAKRRHSARQRRRRNPAFTRIHDQCWRAVRARRQRYQPLDQIAVDRSLLAVHFFN